MKEGKTTENTENTECGVRDPITSLIIGSAIEVHRALGPGLLESVYGQCLAHEFTLQKIPFSTPSLGVPGVLGGSFLLLSGERENDCRMRPGTDD